MTAEAACSSLGHSTDLSQRRHARPPRAAAGECLSGQPPGGTPGLHACRRRRAQLDPVAFNSSALAGLIASSRRPWQAHRLARLSIAPGSSSGSRPSPSRAAIETNAVDAAARSQQARRFRPRPSRPRPAHRGAANPTGRGSSARPRPRGAPQEAASAEATTKMAFDSPPRPVRRAARRETSAIAAAFASIPTTRASGSARALAMTDRPSPAPRSMTTRRIGRSVERVSRRPPR